MVTKMAKRLLTLILIATFFLQTIDACTLSFSSNPEKDTLRPMSSALKGQIDSGGITEKDNAKADKQKQKRSRWLLKICLGTSGLIIAYVIACICLFTHFLNINKRLDRVKYKMDESYQIVQEAQEVRKSIEEMSVELEGYRVPKPSFGLPAGFFDMESKNLPADFSVAAQKAYSAIARILVYEKQDKIDKLVSFGSGVVVSPEGHIMTAYGIIENYISDNKYYIVAEIPEIQNSVRIYQRYKDAEVIQDMSDKPLDIGILKIEPKAPLYYVKAEAVDPRPGGDIFIAGHPRGTQRSYIAVGKSISGTPPIDEPFYFLHNADSRWGNTGSGVFLLDPDGRVRFVGISTGAGGSDAWVYTYMPVAQILKRLSKYEEIIDVALLSVVKELEAMREDVGQLKGVADYIKQAKKGVEEVLTRPTKEKELLEPLEQIEQADEILEKILRQRPPEILYHDIIDNFNPNRGFPLSLGFSTDLSAYLAKAKASRLLSYAESKLEFFTYPTFVLTRSVASTYGHDDEVDRITKDIISSGPHLSAALKRMGICHINISNRNRIIQDSILLNYQTKNVVEEIERILEIENERRELLENFGQQGLSVIVNTRYVEIDSILPALRRINEHIQAIVTAMKGTEIEGIEIANIAGIYSHKLSVDYNEADIVQTIMKAIELDKFRIQINKSLTLHAFTVSQIGQGFNDIPKTKKLLNKIKDSAQEISNLLKERKVTRIMVSDTNILYPDKVLIDYEEPEPLDSIKDALQKADKREAEQNSPNSTETEFKQSSMEEDRNDATELSVIQANQLNVHIAVNTAA